MNCESQDLPYFLLLTVAVAVALGACGVQQQAKPAGTHYTLLPS